VQTPLDDMVFGERLADEVARGRTAGRTRVIEAGGVRIGLVHDFSTGGIEVPLMDGQQLAFPDAPMAEILASKFGTAVDVVACANTHVESVVYRQGVLVVNPGSPNLPGGRRKGGLGTVAILAVTNDAAELEIIDLGAPAAHTV
jgi:predicted phosphodiesterase